MEEKIRELEKEIERLKKLAYRDELTGLINRRALKEQFEPFVQNVCGANNVREGFHISNAAMLFIDLDNFKEVNDKYGHEAGDRVLKNISVDLKENVRGTDAVCRWGGEEFAVLLLGATEDEAYELAEELRQVVERAGQDYGVTASIGVAALSACEKNAFDSLSDCADKAMYQAKDSGKNTISRYSKFL